MMRYLSYLLLVLLLATISSCTNNSRNTLRVAATSIPHAELLEFVKPHLKAQNIQLEIVIIDDYHLPNRALADKEVDANFFQHQPFLDSQKSHFGYSLESLAPIHLEPMAIYSKKHRALSDLKENATIAIPSDPSNQARALALCEKIGLITLKSTESAPTIYQIESNPLKLIFLEIDSPLLCRSIEDVDAALITTNFALFAGLSPVQDALAHEDAGSSFANLLVIRCGDHSRPDLQALKKALTTQQVREFINNKYQGAIIPAF